MRHFLRTGFLLGLIFCLTGGAPAWAQTAKTPAKAPAPPATPAGKAVAGDLFSMLPPSDLIATVDAGRLINDLLPKIAGFSAMGVDKLAKDIADFTQKTGVDPTKLQNVVAGFSLNNGQAQGVVLVQGIDPTAKQVEALMQALKGEYKTSEYKGKTLYNLIANVKAPAAGPVSVKTDEMALATLGNLTVAFGDLPSVKKVIDMQASGEKSGLSPAMVAAIGETRSSALVRFALNIPEALRTEATEQGDLFKSVATIKLVLGTFDVASDLSLSLDTLLRTGSQNEAGELENGLKGLVSLVRGIFAGGDPATDVFAKLFDQIKIGSKAADVSLSIGIPRALMDELGKKKEPK